MLENCLACVSSEQRELKRILEDFNNSFGKLLNVKEWDKNTVFGVEYFTHWICVGSNNNASGAHRFK